METQRERGEASSALRARTRSRMSAETHEGMEDVEVIDADELAPAGVEEDQLAQGEGLERAPEARARAPGRSGHASQLAELARVELDEPVALAERAPADHDRLRLMEPHVVGGGLRGEEEA